MNPQSTKDKIIYVGDPMCSWCYGVSQEVVVLHDHYADTKDFELVMGGLRPYNKETMADLKSFLTHHWDDVHKASGQEFNYDILDSAGITYDTEPPCRATVVVRALDPSKELVFFKKVQKAFYLENKNLHLTASYLPIIKELGLDAEQFTKLFESDEMKEKVKLDFQRAQTLGVTSFPTIILEHNGQRTIVAKGFASSESMIANIERISAK